MSLTACSGGDAEAEPGGKSAPNVPEGASRYESTAVLDLKDRRSEESFVPVTAEPRSWPLPEGLPLIKTWTSKEPTGGHPSGAAFAVARKASLEGRYVRIHTLSHGDSNDAEGTTTSEFVVDVFDTPIPDEEAE